MATQQEVDAALTRLLGRFTDVNDDVRSLLPSRRTIEARCPDLDYVRHAELRNGRIHVLDDPPGRRADIRISIGSDDLVALVNGELPFSRAYTSNRLRLDASMTDLLRLRAVL